MRTFVASMLLVVAGCGPKVDSPKAEGEKSTPLLREPLREEVDLQVLSQDYRTNEVKAEQKYANRRMPCLGYVKKIEKSETGEWRVRFEYFVDGINWGEGNVIALFPTSEAEKLTEYGYRSPLKFEGRCDGFEGIALRKCVVLRDCRVLR